MKLICAVLLIIIFVINTDTDRYAFEESRYEE